MSTSKRPSEFDFGLGGGGRGGFSGPGRSNLGNSGSQSLGSGRGWSPGGFLGGPGRGYTGSGGKPSPIGKGSGASPVGGGYTGKTPWSGWQSKPSGAGGRSSLGSGNTSKGVQFVNEVSNGTGPKVKSTINTKSNSLRTNQPPQNRGRQGSLETSPQPRKGSHPFKDFIVEKSQGFKNNFPFFNGGREPKEDSLDPKTFRTNPRPEVRGLKQVLEDPPFLGGQVAGEAYKYRVRYDVYAGENPFIVNKLSSERIKLGPIIGIVIRGSENYPAIEVAYTASNGSVAYDTIDSASYTTTSFRNYRFEYIIRADGTSQEDDRNEGGDLQIGVKKPPVRTATLNFPSPGNFTPPPPIIINPISFIFNGPGLFWIDPKPTWTNTGKPFPDPKPFPGTETIKTPTPNPSSISEPDGRPFPSPSPKPTGKPISFGGTGTATSTATGTGIGTGTGTATSTATGTGIGTGTGTATSTATGTGSGLEPQIENPLNPVNDLINPSPTSQLEEQPVTPIIKPKPLENTFTKAVPVPAPPSPPVPPGAGGTSGCSSCTKAIGAKVDNLGNALGIANATGQAIDLGLLTVINNKLGAQVDGGISGWLGRFSRSLRLDRAFNILNTMLLLHNAGQLSHRLLDSISEFVESGLDAVGLDDEDGNPIDISGSVGNFVSSTIKSIVGEDIYNGVSSTWKKTSAIYSSTIKLYESTTSMLYGVAEGIENVTNMTGKGFNALKKSGVLLEDSLEWLDENANIKVNRLGRLGQVIEGLESAENVTDNLTEITGNIIEVQDQTDEIKQESENLKALITQRQQEKETEQATAKTDSSSPDLDRLDLVRSDTGDAP